MYLITRQHPGQTLLEAIVAIAVILSAVFSSTTLIISSITAGRISQNRVEAANFAREGVEIIRSFRDGNWLKFQQNEPSVIGVPTSLQPWYSGIVLNNPVSGVPIQRRLTFNIGLGNRWSLEDCAGGCTSGNTGIYRVRSVDSSNANGPREWFAQYASSAACNTVAGTVTTTCTATKYSRSITTTYFWTDTNGNSVAEPDEAYILVASTVSWRDRTGAKTLTAQTRLYDWK